MSSCLGLGVDLTCANGLIMVTNGSMLVWLWTKKLDHSSYCVEVTGSPFKHPRELGLLEFRTPLNGWSRGQGLNESWPLHSTHEHEFYPSSTRLGKNWRVGGFLFPIGLILAHESDGNGILRAIPSPIQDRIALRILTQIFAIKPN